MSKRKNSPTFVKPHKGEITNWFKQFYPRPVIGGEFEGTLGYLIRGTFMDHPQFGHTPFGHTSMVVKHDEETGEIETLNSRYTLVGPDADMATAIVA